jgi:hypothetical protein
VYVCSGKECCEAADENDTCGHGYGGSESVGNAGRQSDAGADTFTESDPDAESDSGWKSNANAFADRIAESITR